MVHSFGQRWVSPNENLTGSGSLNSADFELIKMKHHITDPTMSLSCKVYYQLNHSRKQINELLIHIDLINMKSQD